MINNIMSLIDSEPQEEYKNEFLKAIAEAKTQTGPESEFVFDDKDVLLYSMFLTINYNLLS
jgi:hypothetical protein